MLGQGIDTLDGGMGTDTLSYETTLANRGTTTGVTVTLNASGGGVVSGGDAGADLISNFENVVGSNADDTITGNASANVLLGLNGNDTLNGGAGNDYVDGGDGNDTLNGGDHNDTLYGGDGDDTLIGGSRTDTLNGGDGNDRLYGGILGDDGLHNFDYEVNTLNGDAGDDYLDGGYENCIYDGGEGDDTVMGAYGGSTFFGGSGSDTMDYRLAPASVGAAMADGDQQYIVNRGGLLSDSLYSVENLIGADSASNTLLGNSSANYLSGGSMSDSLSGNGGNDIIDGGLGRDKLTGGVGNDRFVFNAVADSTAGTFRDEITDFAQGVDKIDLSAIDANGAAAGDPLFAFIGTAAFTAPGQIRWNAGSGTVEINVDGTSGAEMGIRLLNEVQPQQGDFVL